MAKKGRKFGKSWMLRGDWQDFFQKFNELQMLYTVWLKSSETKFIKNKEPILNNNTVQLSSIYIPFPHVRAILRKSRRYFQQNFKKNLRKSGVVVDNIKEILSEFE